MGTKIQINSLAALERLIGGDTETEIEIRTSIVKEFVKKYLADIAQTDEMRIAVKGIQAAVEQKIGTWRGSYSWDKKFTLTPDVEKTLSEFINTIVKNKFEELVANSIKKNEWLSKIDAIVEERSEYIMNQWTGKAIEEQIILAADKKIKDKLGFNS